MTETIPTLVEVFYEQSVLEILPATQFDVIEVIVDGPQGPKGVPGSLAGVVVAEVPSGDIDGVNTTFTTVDNFVTIWVYLNGMRQKAPNDYDISGPNTIDFVMAPQVGDSIVVDYATS